MIIAQKKRQENIAEYLLYMFQVEDIIRACNMNSRVIEETIVSQYNQDFEVKREILEWYRSLVKMMKEHGTGQKGHVPMLNKLIDKLNDFHQSLLKNPGETEYTEAYERAKPAIEELKTKTHEPEIKDIEVCLNGLYGLLMLRLQEKTINPETVSAFGFISDFMALLKSPVS